MDEVHRNVTGILKKNLLTFHYTLKQKIVKQMLTKSFLKQNVTGV